MTAQNPASPDGEWLPCPFCGGTDIRHDAHRGEGRGMHHGETVYSMCCYNCGARFPNTYRLELLHEAWNRRAAIASAPRPDAEESKMLSDDQVRHMVDRFLGWKLPENFHPDAGISFKQTFNEHTPHPMKHEPSGTNLFDAVQAEAMVRYMVEGIPAPDLTAALASAPRPDADAKLAYQPTAWMRDIIADELYREPTWCFAAGRPLEEFFGDLRAAALIRAMCRISTQGKQWAETREASLTERAASLERDYAQLDALMKQVSKENQEGHETILALEKKASEALQECERLGAALEEISSMEIAIVSPLARRALGAAK